MQMPGWPVVGHEWAIDLLQQAIDKGRLAHAYLFSGPVQVGKTTVARAFTQALLCEERTTHVRPCGACSACRQIVQGRHPDVQLIAAEKNAIQIEQIRTLQSDAFLSPLAGSHKVFIIREIERATLPAANALLKTLEEPPPQVILLLTSTRPDQVLPTIFSRCQVLGLRPLPVEKVQAALESTWGVDEEHAALLARLSCGRLGWAVTARTNPETWHARTQALDDLLSLTDEGHIQRLDYAERLSRQGDAIERTLGLWAAWWRDVWLIQRGVPDAIVNLDRRAQLVQRAELYRPEQAEGALNDLIRTLHRVKANVNPRLALDVLMLRLPRPAVV